MIYDKHYGHIFIYKPRFNDVLSPFQFECINCEMMGFKINGKTKIIPYNIDINCNECIIKNIIK